METLKEKFQRKIKICYIKQVKEWKRSDQKELIKNAFRIDAAKHIAEILANVLDDREMNYLMQFKDPLKIVTDTWVIEKEYPVDFDEQLKWLVWDLTDRCDADGFYEQEENAEEIYFL